MAGNIFLDITLLFAITVSVAFVIRFLKQPLIIAYIAAGIIAGPLFLNITGGGEELFHAFAEMGVVLLLFMLGLSINFYYIRRVGIPAVVTAVGQVIFTAGIGYLLLTGLFNFSTTGALYLAIAITFSSTMVVVKLLADKGDLETVYGRYTVGLLLVQDLLAVLIMLLMTTVFAGQAPLNIALANLVVQGFAVAVIVILLTKYVLPLFLNRIGQSNEFLFIFTITWCFGVASLVSMLGFSLEIGAVVAGMSLGTSKYQFDTLSRVKPLRDFFIVLFFVILGSEMSLGMVRSAFLPSIVIILFIVVGNPIILYILFRLMKFTRRNSFLVGLTAAQVSEFGFILLFTGQNLGFQLEHELAILTNAALGTFFISSYLIIYNERIYEWVRPFFKRWGPDRREQREENNEALYDVWVVGYHRLGWKLCEVLKEKKTRFAVIDYNPEAIKKLKNRGIPAFFGDAGDVEFLETLPFSKAHMVILTITSPGDQMTLIGHVREKNKNAILIGFLQHTAFLNDLYRAGADFVILPHLLTGEWLVRVLKTKPWTKRTFEHLTKVQERERKLHFTAPHTV